MKDYDKAQIQAVIDQYRLSEIQSESEVRSKFIVGLSEALGYPSPLRGEEFPVYGYAGGECLRAKNADFIFFSESSFGRYRENTQNSKRWVEEHSLLVIEAKKPGKMSKDLGQARFYTMWTRAVAYIETDGENFKGYFVNPISSDEEVIDTKVDELPDRPEIWKFCYENVLAVKQKGPGARSSSSQYGAMEDQVCQIITEDSELMLPEETISYIRDCMGKNAEGLTNVQMVSRFLNTTEAMLQNDMRYGVPSYMLNFPRHTYEGSLYIDDMLFPLTDGKITEFYWNDIARYIFENAYIVIDMIYIKDHLNNFEIGYHILDKRVSDRLDHFGLVGKCLDADSLRIAVDNEHKMQMLLPSGHPGKMWNSRQHVKNMFDFWLSGMEKLKAIEKYYEMEFQLHKVSGQDVLNDLYEAIDIVYNGMTLQQNCELTVPGDLFEEDFQIDEPVLIEEKKAIPLQDRVIQGVVFRPYRSVWLPGKVKFAGKSAGEIVRLPGCCEYRIVEG